MGDRIFIGGADMDGEGAPNDAQSLLLNRANRHGIVAGATGTGKTVTLQILAEGFSAEGVPVFCADVKGDLSGICVSGSPEHKLHPKLISRAEKIGFEDYDYGATPTVFMVVAKVVMPDTGSTKAPPTAITDIAISLEKSTFCVANPSSLFKSLTSCLRSFLN